MIQADNAVATAVPNPAVHDGNAVQTEGKDQA